MKRVDDFFALRNVALLLALRVEVIDASAIMWNANMVRF